MAHVPTGRPRGRPRKNPVPVVAPTGNKLTPPGEFVENMQAALVKDIEQYIAPVVPPAPGYPSDWHPGMLLNVRNGGDALTITLYPEEFDPRHPERALRFTNFTDGQNFVSRWYSRQSHDPRAR